LKILRITLDFLSLLHIALVYILCENVVIKLWDQSNKCKCNWYNKETGFQNINFFNKNKLKLNVIFKVTQIQKGRAVLTLAQILH